MKYLPKTLVGLLIVGFVFNPLFVVAESKNITKEEYLSVNSKEEIIYNQNQEAIVDKMLEDTIAVDQDGNKLEVTKEDKREAFKSANQSLLVNKNVNDGTDTTRQSYKTLRPEVDITTGALRYVYPINVPSGIKNLTPEIGITYNSQGLIDGNSFGYGWQITIPYIQRINKRGSEKIYTSQDFIHSEFGELASVDGSKYAPQIQGTDSASFIYEGGVWTVKNKHGYTYTYGTTPQSRQDNPNDNTKVFTWMLEQVEDVNGNKIKFSYHKEAGQIYPSKIEYAYTDSIPTFSIEFLRTATAERKSYAAGFLVQNKYLINKINIKYKNDLLREYDIEYRTPTTDSPFATIRIITEKNFSLAGVTTLTTSFSYTENITPVQFATSTTYQLPEDVSLQPGSNRPNTWAFVDYNNDSLPDIVKCTNPFYGTPGGCIDNQSYRYYKNTGVNWVLDVTPTQNLLPGSALHTGLMSAYFSDVNGDRKVDVIEGPQTTSNLRFNKVYLNTGNGWQLHSTTTIPKQIGFPESDVNRAYANYDNQGNAIWHGWKNIDVNGDMLPDYILWAYYPVTSTYLSKSLYLNNGNMNGVAFDQNTDFFQNNHLSNFPGSNFILYGGGINDRPNSTLHDLNLDGINDIHRILDYSKISYNEGSDWGTLATSTYTIPALQGYSMDFKVDLNGDGYLDEIVQDNTNGSTAYNQNDIPASWATKKVFLNQHNDTTAETQNGPLFNGFSLGHYPDAIWYPCCNLYQKKPLYFIDVNGDGLNDVIEIARVEGLNATVKNVWMNNLKVPGLLKEITTPQGGTFEFLYKPSSHYKDTGGNILNNNLSYMVQTVSQIKESDGSGNVNVTDYTYAGGYHYFSNPLQKKFSGFKKVTETTATGKKVTYFHQGDNSDASLGEQNDSYAKIGKVFREDITDTQNNLFKRTWYRWNEHDRGNGAWLVTPHHTLTQNYDGNQTHTDMAVTTTYDTTNGNLLTTTEWGEVLGTDTGTFTDTLDDKQTTAITYATNDTQTQFAPKEVVKTNKNDVVVQRTKLYYDNLPLGSLTKGNNTKQEVYKDATNFVTTRTVYNTFGLPIETYDSNNKKTEYTYDTHNLYPKTVTNPLGHVTTYTYDYLSGKPTAIIDPNRTIKLSYDGLGRPLSERIVYANGTEKMKTQYQYVDTPLAVSIKVSKYVSDSDTQDEYTYFDGFKRPIQTKKEFENGQWTTIDTGYSPQGEIAFTSLPYFTSAHTKTSPTTDQSLKTTYTYDPLQRVIQERNALGVTSTEYAGSYRTVTNPLLQRTRYKNDAFGNLTEVMQSLGLTDYTTSYYYNANKNLVKIVDANNNIRNFEYDWLGRQTKAEDVHVPNDTSFAIYQYVYDDNGNVITKILPDGRSVTYTYDDLNRLTHEKVSGTMQVDVMNIYDSCTYGVGRICTASTPEYYKNFTYTQDGFINTETVLHGGAQTTAYTYTPSGDISSVKNLDNSKVVYVRDVAGYIDSIHYVPQTGATSTIVSQIEYAPTGLIISQTNGNDTKTCNVYDQNKLYRLTSKKTVGVGGVCGGTTVAAGESFSATENIVETIDAKIERLISEKKVVENEQGEWRLLVPEVLTESLYEKELLVGFTKDKQPLYQYEVVIGKDIPEHMDQKLAMPDTKNVSQLVATTSLSVSPQATVLATNYIGGNIVPYPNPWDAVRNMATGTNMQPGGGSGYVTSEYGRNRTQAIINRTLMNFDTRNIPDNALFQSAYLDLYGLSYSNASSSDDYIGVLQNLQTSSSSISLIDYSKCGSPQAQPIVGGKKLLSEFTTQQYYRIPLFAAAKPWIDIQGMTRLCLREGHDILNQAPPENTWDFARRGIMVYPETSIINQRSKLIVEYTLPVATTTTAQLPVTIVTPLQQARALQNIHTNNYVYDAVGNITSITTARGTSTPQEAVYTYDALHRLLSRQMGPETESFTYDGTGNILTKNGVPYLYETPQKANPHAVTKIGTMALIYDQHGNVLTIGEQVNPTTNVWSYKNELLQTDRGGLTATYLYDPAGIRVYKEVGGVMTKYPSPYYSYTNTGTTTTFVMLNNENLATITNGGTLWNHIDHLGSTVATTNQTGGIVETTDYTAFGHQKQRGAFAGTQQTEKYTGHTYDPETDLLYAQARYYRGSMGRFLGQDPVFWEINLTNDGKQVLYNPQAQNSYSYANNNPVRYTDPTGRIVPALMVAGGYALEALGIGLTAYSAYNVGNHYYQGTQDQLTGWDYAGAVPGIAVMKAGNIIGNAARGINLMQKTSFTDRIVAREVEVKSFGKTIYQGSRDLTDEIRAINDGKGSPRLNSTGGIKTFENRENFKLDNFSRGYYKEYNLHKPVTSGNGSSPERLLVGKRGETYYSPDHYSSQPIKVK